MWAQYLILVAAVAATFVAGRRFVHYRTIGNSKKMLEFRYKLWFGGFVVLLVVARFFVFHA